MQIPAEQPTLLEDLRSINCDLKGLNASVFPFLLDFPYHSLIYSGIPKLTAELLHDIRHQVPQVHISIFANTGIPLQSRLLIKP